MDSYINYLAINRKRAKKAHYNNNLKDIKDDLEESRLREKFLANKLEKQNDKIQTLIDRDSCYAEKMMQLLNVLKQNPQIAKSLVHNESKKLAEVFG
jgi:cell division FtsZ-interacting protein ZapD